LRLDHTITSFDLTFHHPGPNGPSAFLKIPHQLQFFLPKLSLQNFGVNGTTNQLIAS
jgi:hypothetical protein